LTAGCILAMRIAQQCCPKLNDEFRKIRIGLPRETDERMQIQTNNWWYFIRSW